MGQIIFEHGLEAYRLEATGNRAYEIAFELRPDIKQWYHQVDGNWTYNEDAEEED